MSKSLEKFKTKLNVKKNISCEQCIYLNKEKLKNKVCSDFGVLPTSKICASFKPNVHSFRNSNGANNVIDLFEAIRNLQPSMLPLVASLLLREERTRKYTKFKIFQPVAVNISGNGDYLEDYCKAYVLDADKQYFRIINKKGTLIAQLPLNTTSVLTVKEFKKLKPSLKKNKIKTGKKSFSLEVPTIDTVVKEGKINKKLLKKSDIYTLFKELSE